MTTPTTEQVQAMLGEAVAVCPMGSSAGHGDCLVCLSIADSMATVALEAAEKGAREEKEEREGERGLLDKFDRAPRHIILELVGLADQADKHQWFNFLGRLGQLAGHVAKELRDDLNGGPR